MQSCFCSGFDKVVFQTFKGKYLHKNKNTCDNPPTKKTKPSKPPAPFKHEKEKMSSNKILQTLAIFNNSFFVFRLFFDAAIQHKKKHQDDSTTETSRYILRPEALEGAENNPSLYG